MKEKGLSSRETTLNLINDLVREGKLNKKEINSQVHFLTINEDNEYNRIFKELSEIELIILRMFDNYMIIRENRENRVLEKASTNIPFNSLDNILTLHYPMIIDILLHILLIRIKNKINLEIDKEILYPKIITLMDLMDRIPASIRGLEFLEHYAEYVKKTVTKNSIKVYARDMGIKLSVIDNLLSKTDYFKKEFLGKDEQKTAKALEKSG